MSSSQRFRDWVAGRHEFRALVDLGPGGAAPPGARAVSGSGCVEIDQVEYGSKRTARLAAVQSLRSRLDAELPDAQILALLDDGPPRRPDPVLRLAGGRGPRLLLVGADTDGDTRRLLSLVSRIWTLPNGQYTSPEVPDPRQQRQLVALAAIGIVLAAPMFLRWATAGPSAVNDLVVPRLFSSSPIASVAIGVAVAVSAAVLILVRRRGWSGRRRWTTAVASLIGPAAVVLPMAVSDAVSLGGQAYPVLAVLIVGALCVAAVPLLVSRIERPRLWAVLAWGLPLLGGGIAPFVGEMVLDRYLAHFELSYSDLQIALWSQWALGAAATAVLLLGVYVAVAFWMVSHRLSGSSAVGTFMTILVSLIYFVSALQIILDRVDAQARLSGDGVPGALVGLRPVVVCADPVEVGVPYSYLGRAPVPPGAAAIYFGRADGRLAVWTQASGGVLLDSQQVALRTVADRSDCG